MYNSNEVSMRIKALAKERKITVKQVLISAGLSDNLMAGMKNSMPKADTLAKIADVLDCTVDYLLGRNDTDPQAEEFLRMFVKLPKEDRDTILTLINKLNKS